MMNQLLPIVDVALVCAEPQSLARFDNAAVSPPGEVRAREGLFADSVKMEADLGTYAAKLSAARVRFHIQRAAISLQAAKWSNN